MENLSQNFYKTLLENIDMGIYFVDTTRMITFFNKAAERITGYKAEEVIGSRCVDNLFNHIDKDGHLLCVTGCPLHSTIVDGKNREADVFLHHKDGHRVPVRVNASQIVSDRGDVIGAVETFYDTSIEYRIEKENEDLKYLSMVDELTRIPNRRYLSEWLIAKHREFQKFGKRYGVLIIDIDNFKFVNDNYGHLVGDEMLKVVSKTLTNAKRTSDVVARFGGEEFVLVSAGVDEEVLHSIAKRVCSLIFNSTLEVGQEDLSVSVSIGATVVKEIDEIKNVLTRADTYLYKAKNTGKNRVCSDLGIHVIGHELNTGRDLNNILKQKQLGMNNSGQEES